MNAPRGLLILLFILTLFEFEFNPTTLQLLNTCGVYVLVHTPQLQQQSNYAPSHCGF